MMRQSRMKSEGDETPCDVKPVSMCLEKPRKLLSEQTAEIDSMCPCAI